MNRYTPYIDMQIHRKLNVYVREIDIKIKIEMTDYQINGGMSEGMNAKIQRVSKTR